MKTAINLLFSFGILFGLGAQAQLADDTAFLDPKYSEIRPPADDSESPFFRDIGKTKNDVLEVVSYQSPVRAQGARGTCSIFSATSLLESLLIKNFELPNDVDLSEEWLEYVTHLDSAGEGSTSNKNFRALAGYGSVQETTWPYLGETWEDVNFSALSRSRCGHLQNYLQDICLVSHRDPRLISMDLVTLNKIDPEFLSIRKEASEFKAEYMDSVLSNPVQYVGTVSRIKNLLNKGVPVTLDLDFYYGAWNHREATALGVQRNMDHWAKGIVGYPAVGSLDREVSSQKPAGHSVVVVGYDDEMEIVVPTQMSNGKVENLKYKGVYFFKNSWGTSSFGVETKIEGRRFPGYGIITQKYANEFGGFYMMPLSQ